MSVNGKLLQANLEDYKLDKGVIFVHVRAVCHDALLADGAAALLTVPDGQYGLLEIHCGFFEHARCCQATVFQGAER